MRVIAFPMLAALAVFASAAFAQIEANPPTPYSTGPLPEIDTGTGRIIVEPDGSWKTVKAAPCSKAARGTDGFTTCVGLPSNFRVAKAKKVR